MATNRSTHMHKRKQTVAVTLVAGVAFHFAIENMLATRPQREQPGAGAVRACVRAAVM